MTEQHDFGTRVGSLYAKSINQDYGLVLELSAVLNQHASELEQKTFDFDKYPVLRSVDARGPLKGILVASKVVPGRSDDYVRREEIYFISDKSYYLSVTLEEPRHDPRIDPSEELPLSEHVMARAMEEEESRGWNPVAGLLPSLPYTNILRAERADIEEVGAKISVQNQLRILKEYLRRPAEKRGSLIDHVREYERDELIVKELESIS